MSDHRSHDEEVQRAVLIIAAFLFVPLVVLAVIFWITQTLGPWLWVFFIAGLGAAGAYVNRRLENSAPVVRSDHEKEIA